MLSSIVHKILGLSGNLSFTNSQSTKSSKFPASWAPWCTFLHHATILAAVQAGTSQPALWGPSAAMWTGDERGLPDGICDTGGPNVLVDLFSLSLCLVSVLVVFLLDYYVFLVSWCEVLASQWKESVLVRGPLASCIQFLASVVSNLAVFHPQWSRPGLNTSIYDHHCHFPLCRS